MLKFVKLYENEKLWNEILSILNPMILIYLILLIAKTKQILQADVVFCKKY